MENVIGSFSQVANNNSLLTCKVSEKFVEMNCNYNKSNMVLRVPADTFKSSTAKPRALALVNNYFNKLGKIFDAKTIEYYKRSIFDLLKML